MSTRNRLIAYAVAGVTALIIINAVIHAVVGFAVSLVPGILAGQLAQFAYAKRSQIKALTRAGGLGMTLPARSNVPAFREHDEAAHE